eukprot:scaffold43883_cov191-Amphora_coffeaeformis.AAC.1
MAKMDPRSPFATRIPNMSPASTMGILWKAFVTNGSMTPCSIWYRKLLTIAMNPPVYREA